MKQIDFFMLVVVFLMTVYLVNEAVTILAN